MLLLTWRLQRFKVKHLILLAKNILTKKSFYTKNTEIENKIRNVDPFVKKDKFRLEYSTFTNYRWHSNCSLLQKVIDSK